jgi:membrane fusion protein (multidrug efflux system)
MPMNFDRTLRSLEAPDARGLTFKLVVALALLAGWTVWLFRGSVPLYESTDAARVEVQAAAYPVASAVEGRVVRSTLALGGVVARGDVLVEIDAEPQRLTMDESRARLHGLERRIAALRVERSREAEALREQVRATEIAAAQARSTAREADLRAAAAERDAATLRQLLAHGSVSRAEWERADTEARARRASAEALALAARGAVAEGRVQGGDRGTRVAELDRQIAEAVDQAAVERAVARSLEHAGELRRVRAPIAGRVAGAGPLNPGMVVRAGDTLASIVPEGRLRVTADFPATALGRIRPGQPARMRLDAFPWTQYGRIRGRVARVAREPRGELVRVEILIHSDRGSPVPLAHALRGSVDVEVDRAAPATLLLRTAGSPRARVVARPGRGGP